MIRRQPAAAPPVLRRPAARRRVERPEDKDGWQVLGCIDEGEIAMGSCIHATGEYAGG